MRGARVGLRLNNLIDNALAFISPLTGTLNANNNQVTNLRLENLTTTQTAGNAGRVYFQSTVDNIHLDDGSTMRSVPAITPVATGYMAIVNTASAFIGLAPGTTGQVLTMAGTGLPAWGSGAASVIQVQVFS